jgi:ribosomal protein S18 acetylase RimI-like enzyme
MLIVRQIREVDAQSFRSALDLVCRERKYLAQLEAPALERVQAFVSSNVKAGYPQVVAEDDGTIVGWCDAIPGDDLSGMRHVGRLGMGVLKAYRGRKIGRRLLEDTIERAAQFGLERIELSVHASNERAISLYRSAGFEEEGRKTRAWLLDGAYDDILLMALDLKKWKS